MNLSLFRMAAAAAAAALSCASWAQCRVDSGTGTAALIELYTSEGCSSCPPADRWLGALPADEITAGHLVPIALHVDYWDNLGWKDPFAKADFTARQQQWRALNHGPYVYTPQVVLAGRDYPEWSDRSSFWRDVKTINDAPAGAHIQLQAHPHGPEAIDVTVTVSVARAQERRDASLFIATTESGVSSRVGAGENGGSTLTHDHVAQTWIGPVALDPAEDTVVSRTLPVSAERGGALPGVVAFVENVHSGRILQAVALQRCR